MEEYAGRQFMGIDLHRLGGLQPDGRSLATGGADRSVWDLANPALPQVLTTLTCASDRVLTVEFGPSGCGLAAGSADGSVHLWLIDPAEAAALVCGVAGEPITPTEWVVQYLPGRATSRAA